MTTYSSFENGEIRPEELAYLKRRAEGGFGSVITAACYVHKSGHAFDLQWSCASDNMLDSMRATADAIHQGGAAAIIQIHHGGRACPSRLCGRVPMSASAIPAERPNAETPAAMTKEEIAEIIEAFAKAATRSKAAGFDAIEIHGANTYLLQQFVSPHSNRRDDEWGADRLKFPLAVADAVFAAVGPGYPVGYRFSPEEVETPGIRITDTEALIEALLSRPLAYLHLSLQDFRQTSLVGDYDEPTLKRVLRKIDGRMPLMVAGSIKTVADAEEALSWGAALLSLARMAIIEPEWPLKAMAGEPMRSSIPAHGAGELLTLPEGLEKRIYNATGWFPVEPEEELANT